MFNLGKVLGPVALAACMFGAVASNANAGTITVNSFSVPHNVSVHSYDPSAGIHGEYSSAGQIDLKVAQTSNGPVSDMLVWCVDLFDWLRTPAVYTTGGSLSTDGNGNGHALSDTQINQVNALITHGDAMLAGTEARTRGYSKNEVSSAIQIAIWSAELGSSYTFKSDDHQVDLLVTTYLANVSGAQPVWSPTPFSKVATLWSPGSQTLGYLQVPEPHP